MRKLAGVTGVIVALVLGGPVVAQTGAVMAGAAPGKAGIAQTVKLTATITAIDPATRDVTLKGPQGNEVVVTAGPEVKNFASLKVGDQVDAQYLEALTLELKKGGGMVVARTMQSGMTGAKPGEMPAGAVGRQVTIVADVVGLDPAKQVVTLKGPQRTVDLHVTDPEQFKRIAKGDQVEATFTQALAMAVVKK
jgi:Cu/Ag efflux protein CusF